MVIEIRFETLFNPVGVILDECLLHVAPTLRFLLPEIARKAQLRKEGDFDLFGLEDLHGPEHFVLVGFNIGDYCVQVGKAKGRKAIV